MVCPRCCAAADARAPRDQHCDANGGPGAACDCAHRVERYSDAPDPDCDCQPPRPGGHDAHCLALCTDPAADHTNGCPRTPKETRA
ncbi:hypothetical protein RM780_04130 [Streptomyces sp. DSM 44917]|uniref:Uncharacterized protein n=1 Tax=Streptomyces boetiae TaxID=3075541 RepID=A0ABU2L3P7_9ACTN|nr:hypothetical protein [Streptomyces sp. DSM 44917]MDT0306150.1 hypothetical protein [Streptomyces sp. DSM 44917]